MRAVRISTDTPDEREEAIEQAALAIRRGEIIVIPTDTVYGVAADAFDPGAVRDLLSAKGRGREMPPPVLIAQRSTADALAVGVPGYARALMAKFWPGPLTVVLRQQESLQWDIGDTRGTVALRVPDHQVTRDLLTRTGPLAVSSANTSGSAAAVTADQADDMLGDEVVLIVDDGPSPGKDASTIIDATGERPRLLRLGALSVEVLDEALAPLAVSVLDEG